MNKKNTKKFRKRLGDNEKILNPFCALFFLEDKSYFNKNGKKIKQDIFMGDFKGPIKFNTYNLTENKKIKINTARKYKKKLYHEELLCLIVERRVNKSKKYKSKILEIILKIIDKKLIFTEEV